MGFLRSFATTSKIFTLFEERTILAQGELISTTLINDYLCESGVKSVLLPALDFMKTDKNAEPDMAYIKEQIAVQLEKFEGEEILYYSKVLFVRKPLWRK